MWALIADSLLTGLPSLVRPTGSSSKTKAYITSFYTSHILPSSPAAIYLPLSSCHLSFLAIVFSCLLAWPLVSLERCMWISGSLLFSFFLPTCHDSLIGPRSSLWSFPASSKHLGHHQRQHITAGAEFNRWPLWFKCHLFPPFYRGLVSEGE